MKCALVICTSLASAWLAAAPPEGMALIPAGEYTPLFTKDAKPRRVAAFLLDVEPVTNAQFLEFVRKNPQWRRSQVKEIFAESGYLRPWAADLEPGVQAPPEAPVVNVSWFAARAYLKSLGKRLPTTDEWEFAACASATQADASRDTAFTAKILSWYAQTTPPLLPEVHRAETNFYGVRGLHGLVWEWVADFNNAMSGGEGRDRDNLDRNLFCGAGALGGANPDSYAAFMRFAFRSSLQGSYCVANLGFRGAKSVSSP
jgi:formylglycine-generating enzyme required for sulfatase activity